MVHLSKRKLPEKTHAYIKNQLTGLMFAQKTRKECQELLFELLAPSEYMMFAKRVAAISLLDKGYSSYQVANLLCMSHVTLMKLHADMENNVKYVHIRKTLKRKNQREDFLETINALLTYGKATPHLRKQLEIDIDRWRAGA